MKTSELPDPVLPNPEMESLPRGDDYRHLANNLQTMRNRVGLLKQQLAKEQESIARHKSMTEDIIQKKRNVGEIYKFKRRDSSTEQKKVQQLRQRNNSLREQHKTEMQNILKALYLVKLDDARTLKGISNSHRQRIRELDEQELQKLKERREQVAQQSMLARYRLQRYWKERAHSVMERQQEQRQSLEALMQEQKEELRMLQEEEISILKEINKLHDKSSQTKKEYMAALSIPVRQVIEALPSSPKSSRYASDIDLHASMPPTPSPVKLQSSLLASRDITIPNTKVDGNKFKIILNQLKRLQKEKEREKQRQRQKEKQQDKQKSMSVSISVAVNQEKNQSISQQKKSIEKSKQKKKPISKQKQKDKSVAKAKQKDMAIQPQSSQMQQSK